VLPCSGCALEATEYFCKFISLLSNPSQPKGAVKAVDSHIAQDAVSCLYHIQRLYGGWLAALGNAAGNAAIVGIGMALLAFLQVRL